MRYLVTGGMGYIGENIILQYQSTSRKDDIVEFDACDYGDCGSDLYGVAHPDLPLAHKLTIEDLSKYDGVIHLASLSGLTACEQDPQLAFQQNVMTAMNVFSIMAILGKPVVFTSSQAAKDPQSSKYANIKWICEQIASYYNNSEYNAGIYVLRLANVYGGYEYIEKKSTCVKQFITCYNNGYPLIVHGDGNQTRDFVHVWDVCEAIMLALETRPSDKTPMDIGTGKATSIMELQEMFPRKQNQHYEYLQIRDVGADSSIADISVAKDRIGFEAKLKIEDYIKESIS